MQGACKMTDVHCPLRCGATIKRYDSIMHTVTIPFLCACLLSSRHELKGHSRAILVHFKNQKYQAPNDNFRENICSEDDLRSRIFGTFVVKFLACLPLLGFSNI